MSGEKKRHRCRRGPLLIEENLIINSTSTTVTTRTQEEKHSENTRRKWHHNDEDNDNDKDIQLTTLLPNETISEKIDRVLRKINAWTNETSTNNTNNNNNTIQQETSFKKTTKPSYNYDNIRQGQYDSDLSKPSYTALVNSFRRRRCTSTTYGDPSMIKTQQISTHRPHSMAFIDKPSPPMTTSFDEGQNRKNKMFHRQNSLDPNRYQYHRRSMYSPKTNLRSQSSMYGSDFFYPPDQDQHEYDNLTFTQNSFSSSPRPQHYNPFPTILVDCQRCSRSVDPSSLRDISCQVPSDEDLYQDIQLEHRQTSRSSPLYISPRSSPTLCHPPLAKNLLAPYHLRRKHSLSSYVAIHNRSKSVPSSSSTSSTISNRKTRLPPLLSPLPSTVESNPVPSTTTLLRSIKTSIYAMKKRLKDIRRLSEDSNVTTVLDDYTARSSQELTVTKGQHVRVVQKQPPNAPDWCLIRLLNDYHQQNQSSPSSLAASSTTIRSESGDLPITPTSKYTEGLVPAVILKSTKSSSTSIHLPPPLISGRSEQDDAFNNIDESPQRQSSSVFQFNKQKSSFRKILKNPVRRFSLKDNSSSKDVKSPLPRDLIATSTSVISRNSGDGISINKQQSLSSNFTTPTRNNTFTLTNSDDLTSSFPDDTSSASKSMDINDNMNGIYKVTESTSSPSSYSTIVSPRDDLETDVIETSSSTDIQSLLNLSTDTNVDYSSIAPISIVTGFSASDFSIPAVLSVTTPSANDTSTANMPSLSTITVIENDNQTEPTDETSLNDNNQTTLSSITITDEPVDDRTKYGEKRRHNIVELIETEKEYVKDLALIVEGYMNIIENDKEIKKPTGIVGRERVVFGNVQRIYEFHRDTFSTQLEQCIENPNILGRLFTTNRFNPYVKYCENKPRSEYIVSEFHDYFEEIRKKLGQKLLVSDLLIKPVQRIMRYQLLLKEILKSTERMGDESRAIRSALQVMIEVPQQANDMMNVGRIKDLTTNVHQLGEMRLQDMLSVSEPISKDTKDAKEIEKKLKERRVFLFQQSMIFCDEIPAKDKYSSPNYIYKYELKINKLQHKEFKRNKEAFQFTLVEVDAGNTRRVICQCKDDEQYELWVTNVNKVLQRQMDLIIALTNPTAALQKELLTWEIPEWRQAGRRLFTSGDSNVTLSSHSNTQDSSTLLFTPLSRNQIKKSMSERTSKSSELSPSSKTTSQTASPADIRTEHPNKKSSLPFHLLDSILPRSVTKSLTMNITHKKTPARSSSSSCPQSSSIPNIQLPEQARCLYNYNAIKEDELCVHRGEYVQILNVDQDNRWFVRRHVHRTSSTTKGWLPGFVLGLKYPNSTVNKTNLSPVPLTTSSLSSNSLNHL